MKQEARSTVAGGLELALTGDDVAAAELLHAAFSRSRPAVSPAYRLRAAPGRLWRPALAPDRLVQHVAWWHLPGRRPGVDLRPGPRPRRHT